MPALTGMPPYPYFEQLGCLVAAACAGDERGWELCQEGLGKTTLCDLDSAIFYLRDLMTRQSSPHSAEKQLEQVLLERYSQMLAEREAEPARQKDKALRAPL